MKKFPRLGAFAVCFAIGCTPIAFADDDAAEEPVEKVEKVEAKIKKLGIGSVAPSLDVEHWLDDSKEPVTEFASDQVYVVEFWATWCGPCLYSMPHLAELQSKYADQGVRMISISREDLETVTEFLDKPVSASILEAAQKRKAASEETSEEEEEESEPITYGQLTSSYSLTTDPDASSSNDYMKAANQNGIPCAFIVGKDGHIEWIGHPMSMDEPLAKVVAGDWDREAAKIEFALSEERTTKYRQIAMADRAGKHDKVMELLTETKELFAGSQYESYLEGMKFNAALQGKQTDAVLAEISRLTQRDGSDYSAINAWAWDVYAAVSEGYPKDEEIVAATMNALENAVSSVKAKEAELGETLWPAYDTLAHLKAHAGDKEAAIAWQTKAIELAPEEEAESLQAFLNELTGKSEVPADGAEAAEAKDGK